jgi:hypothetical protein
LATSTLESGDQVNLYKITPEFFCEGWDADDALERVKAVLNWLVDCPLADIAVLFPSECIGHMEGDALT